MNNPCWDAGRSENSIMSISLCRLMIVDDDDDLLFLMEQMALRAGVFSEIITALGAQSGLKILGEITDGSKWPDIIVTDLKMPVINGAEFARHIRQTVDGARTTVICVSSSLDPQEQRASLEAGCDAFMTKPDDLAALRQFMSSLPSRRRKHGDSAAVQT